jgi:hypothetical protein
MGLDDFEKELAAKNSNQAAEDGQSGHAKGARDEERRRRHHHHRHHRPSRRDDSDTRHKRRHESRRDEDEHEDDDDEEEKKRRERRSKRRRSRSRSRSRSHNHEQAQGDIEPPRPSSLHRDSWMEAPSSLHVDYIQRQRPKSPKSQFVSAKDQPDTNDRHQRPKDLEKEEEEDEEEAHEPVHHDVSYTFGDQGSQWRMTKLHAVYRQAKDSGRRQEDVAYERYGSLRLFDDAREEEHELDRRQIYGNDYVGLEQPSGELFAERNQNASPPSPPPPPPPFQSANPNQRQLMPEAPPSTTVPLDQTALNKLKAQLIKAKLRKAPNVNVLEAEYEAAAAASTSATTTKQSTTITLSATENRMLTGGRGNEIKHMENKRGRERGHVQENEDMSIQDMVRQERRTRNTGNNQGKAFAERIAKDAKFTDDLDYMDENATRLAQNVAKSEINLRNTAIGDYQKMQRTLDSCPLCHHEDTNTPPQAPIVSLATRVYMTLPTEPELTSSSSSQSGLGGAVIVPITHHLNLVECDDDEWEEIRNFMKSLTRLYHSQDRGVIFYENAAHMHTKRSHAALTAIPLPAHLSETAPAYFKEAILSADEEWSQHKPIIDTLANSQRAGMMGKLAFRKSLPKEMPYFHVWFALDGGFGHVVEDDSRWPRGDLFAREVIGGMLGKGPEVIKKQGRWTRHDARLAGFRNKWDEFDWTKVLMG